MIRTPLLLHRSAAALIVAACAAAIAVPAALGQPTAQITANPNSGAPGSQFTITMKNYRACAADSPNCIIIDFVESGTTTRIGTADSKGSDSFSGNVSVPPGAKAGGATVRAHSTLDDASTGFTVTAPGVSTTTSTTSATTSTTSATSTTTTVAASTTTVSTVVLAPTTTTSVPVTVKKTSSHSDVPRYIAVGLVVAAAAATAAVDTRLRRLRG